MIKKKGQNNMCWGEKNAKENRYFFQSTSMVLRREISTQVPLNIKLHIKKKKKK